MDPEEFEFWGKKIPERLHHGLRNYLLHHVPCGHFLTAVLENDLKEACARGDDECMWLLPVIVAYLYNEAPCGSWGSKANVNAWLAARVVEEEPDPRELRIELLTEFAPEHAPERDDELDDEGYQDDK